MYQIIQGRNKTLTSLVDNHYQQIVKPLYDSKGKIISYENGSIVLRIKRKIKTLKGQKGVSFFKNLLENDNLILNSILSGSPKELQKIANKINTQIKARSLPGLNSKIGKKTFKEHIESVFNYDSLMKKADAITEYDGYFLANELGINACPYCNRSYTITVIKNRDKIVRPEFDHFFCQKYFPYLSISFYNLIPSCHICNSNIKGDDRFSIKNNYHPYLQNFDDIINFSVKFNKKKKIDRNRKSSIRLFYGDTDSFTLAFISNRKASLADISRAKRHIKKFKLDELYSYHKDIVVEYIHNSIINNNSRIDELFNKYQGRLFSSRDDVKRFATGNLVLSNELHLRPFSKLSKDIHTEFGMKI